MTLRKAPLARAVLGAAGGAFVGFIFGVSLGVNPTVMGFMWAFVLGVVGYSAYGEAGH